MLESFMEDLLWRYPDDFFPGRGFKPVKRQFTLSDGRRPDVSFRDKNERLWVIEVKAVPVRYADADQVHHYAEKLREANPSDPPIPALVAPYINSTVSETLVRWAIEPFEISEAAFRRVATERGVEMESTKPTTTTDAMTEGIQRGTRALSSQATHEQAGAGPQNGWYNLQSKATRGKWSDPANWVWHYRKDGTTVCGAHSKPATAVRTNAEYVPGAQPAGAPGRTCSICAAAVAKGL